MIHIPNPFPANTDLCLPMPTSTHATLFSEHKSTPHPTTCDVCLIFFTEEAFYTFMKDHSANFPIHWKYASELAQNIIVNCKPVTVDLFLDIYINRKSTNLTINVDYVY